MTTILVALLSLFTITYGKAAYYDQGVMESVVYVRQNTETWGGLSTEVPAVIGFVALNDCEELNSLVWLWHEDPLELAGPYWVVDCRAEQDVLAAEVKGIVVEVDYNTAKRWGVVGFGPSYINVAVIRRRP